MKNLSKEELEVEAAKLEVELDKVESEVRSLKERLNETEFMILSRRKRLLYFLLTGVGVMTISLIVMIFVTMAEKGIAGQTLLQKSLRPVDVMVWASVLLTVGVLASLIYRFLQGEKFNNKKDNDSKLRLYNIKVDNLVMEDDVDYNSTNAFRHNGKEDHPLINEKVSKHYEQLINGLIDEIDLTRRNSSVNLIIGIITSAIGIIVLTTAIFYSAPQSQVNTSNELPIYFPFISKVILSLFVELFSFFFLRLYRKNLDDIKYLTNEVTNVMLKMLALEYSLTKESSTVTGDILRELSKTERNFILKKDESTVEIQKMRIEENGQEKLIENLVSILKKG